MNQYSKTCQTTTQLADWLRLNTLDIGLGGCIVHEIKNHGTIYTIVYTSSYERY